MKTYRTQPLVLIAFAAVAACVTVPAGITPLEQARADYSNAQANTQVTSLAAGELRQAGETLDRANAASNKGEDRVIIDHLAYVADQQVKIAQETASQKAAELAVARAGAERSEVRLDARTREAEMAQRNAESSQRQSEASQRQSEASQRSAEDAQRSAEASQRRSEASQRSAEDAQQNAQYARMQTMDAENRSRALEMQLKEMDAKKTDRGMVITLGDVLFDTNQSQLRSGGLRNVQKLADFFKQYPQRTALIEGFTDSTGGATHNMELSFERAGAVRTALLDMGIEKDRMTSRGYGESYPVAGNDTASGRQLNRRVEIVVSDDTGKIAPR
jgi:outer membrane protein OmpA-like peptidoglycan-associated protein